MHASFSDVSQKVFRSELFCFVDRKIFTGKTNRVMIICLCCLLNQNQHFESVSCSSKIMERMFCAIIMYFLSCHYFVQTKCQTIFKIVHRINPPKFKQGLNDSM